MPHLHAGARVWGTRFDHLASSPPPSPPSLRSATAQRMLRSPQDLSGDLDPKSSQSCSVFVGNMPATLDKPILRRELHAILSPFGDFRIKIVPPTNKGPACAFIHCDSHEAAEVLLESLHNSPTKYIHGRELRFELARGHSVLYISYCAPHSNRLFEDGSNAETAVNLPRSLKILSHSKQSKPDTGVPKTYSVSFDDSAESSMDSEEPPVDVLTLQPIQFNAETIRRLAEVFGPLTRLELYNKQSTGSDTESITDVSHLEDPKSYPFPHDGPRSPDMDPRCWEVEWARRDDCAAAEYTFKSIPFVKATWAHFRVNDRSPHHGMSRFIQSSSMPFSRTPDRSPSSVGYQNYQNTPASPISYPNFRYFGLRSPPGADASNMTSSPNGFMPTTRRTADDIVPLESGLNDRKLSWGDMDYPSLNDPVGDNDYPTECWADLGAVEIQPDDDDRTPRVQLSKLKLDITPTLDQSGHSSPPGFGMSPTTPQTPESFPPTPTVTDGTRVKVEDPDDVGHSKDAENRDGKYHHYRQHTARATDPFSLFVGDLLTAGPDAWDEEKLRNYFASLPGLIEIQVYQKNGPSHAFIKFDNMQSPRQAVAGERQRKENGEPYLRVQIRELQPKGHRAFGRGRGRGAMFHSVSRHQGSPQNSTDQSSNQHINQAVSNLSDVCPSVATMDQEDQQEVYRKHPERRKMADHSRPQMHASSAFINPDANFAKPPRSTDNMVPAFGPAIVPGSQAMVFGPPSWGMPSAAPCYYGHHPGYMVPSPGSNQPIDSPVASYFPGPFGCLPYPSYPRTSPVDHLPGHVNNHQPPVRAAGFIRQDEGPLYALYNAEDLTKYMSGGRPPLPQLLSQAQNHHQMSLPNGAMIQSHSNPGMGPTPGWQYPQIPPYFQVPHLGPVMSSHPSRQFANVGSPAGWHPHPHPPTSVSFSSPTPQFGHAPELERRRSPFLTHFDILISPFSPHL